MFTYLLSFHSLSLQNVLFMDTALWLRPLTIWNIKLGMQEPFWWWQTPSPSNALLLVKPSHNRSSGSGNNKSNHQTNTRTQQKQTQLKPLGHTELTECTVEVCWLTHWLILRLHPYNLWLVHRHHDLSETARHSFYPTFPFIQCVDCWTSDDSGYNLHKTLDQDSIYTCRKASVCTIHSIRGSPRVFRGLPVKLIQYRSGWRLPLLVLLRKRTECFLFLARLLQLINNVMSLPVCRLVVPQESQHFRSPEVQAT